MQLSSETGLWRALYLSHNFRSLELEPYVTAYNQVFTDRVDYGFGLTKRWGYEYQFNVEYTASNVFLRGYARLPWDLGSMSASYSTYNHRIGLGADFPISNNLSVYTSAATDQRGWEATAGFSARIDTGTRWVTTRDYVSKEVEWTEGQTINSNTKTQTNTNPAVNPN